MTEEETTTIYTACAILEGLVTRERDADVVLESEPEDAGKPEPEPEGKGDRVTETKYPRQSTPGWLFRSAQKNRRCSRSQRRRFRMKRS